MWRRTSGLPPDRPHTPAIWLARLPLERSVSAFADAERVLDDFKPPHKGQWWAVPTRVD